MRAFQGERDTSSAPSAVQSDSGEQAAYPGSERQRLALAFIEKFRADGHDELRMLAEDWDDAMMHVGQQARAKDLGLRIVRGVSEHYLQLEGLKLLNTAKAILDTPDLDMGAFE